MFCEPYCNIFLVARKKSGKSTVIWTILKECVGQSTTVLIFCSTIKRDNNWKEIVKWLDKNRIKHMEYTTLATENGKTNRLDEVMQKLLQRHG